MTGSRQCRSSYPSVPRSAHMSQRRNWMRLLTQPPQKEMAADSRRYLALAHRLLRPAPRRLIAIGGVSGTGKSTLAAGLAPELGLRPGARVLRSDVTRKLLLRGGPGNPASSQRLHPRDLSPGLRRSSSKGGSGAGSRLLGDHRRSSADAGRAPVVCRGGADSRCPVFGVLARRTDGELGEPNSGAPPRRLRCLSEDFSPSSCVTTRGR